VPHAACAMCAVCHAVCAVCGLQVRCTLEVDHMLTEMLSSDVAITRWNQNGGM
jgi:hypothetical protein